MIRKVFLITSVMLAIAFYAKAQQVNKVVKETVSRGLQATFTPSVLVAYQASAQNRIEDMYQYFQLLSDTATPKKLKKEIEASVYDLFKSNDVLVLNMLEDNNKKVISLSSFIEQLVGQPVTFKVFNVENGPILFDGWQANYNLQISRPNSVYELAVTQMVRLTKEIKSFGDVKKEVWQVCLGEIQQQ